MRAFIITAILLSRCITAVPTAPISTPKWINKKCTDQYLNDAAAKPSLRWNAADASSAWTSVELAWNQEATRPGDERLSFSGFVGNYFNTKDRLECDNLAINPCDDTVLCSGANHPAGWLIVNSLVAIHSVQKAIYDALVAALPIMQSHISTFQATFAPAISDNAPIIKEILDAFLLLFGLGSAFVWNIIAKEAAWFTYDPYRLTGKDAVNSLILFGINSLKENAPIDPPTLQGKLSDTLGIYFQDWEKSQTDYLHATFKGTSASLTALHKMIDNGMALTVVTPDLGTLATEIQHLMYAKIVPVAWNLAPGDFMPFILKTSNPCSSTAQGDVHGIMSDQTAAQTHVCYDGFTFYVVTPTWENNRGIISGISMNELPGGTWQNMQNQVWAGIGLDDFVISSWEAYKLNGNKNGYSVPSDGAGTGINTIFDQGVRTPGFAQLPLCDLNEFKKNIAQHSYNSRWPGFPCDQN